MKDRDHNEAMASLFQADPRFAADYLRQVLADGEPADVRAGLQQMADVLRVSQVGTATGSAPSAGLFDRVGVRYEVACDVIGGLISHYAEMIGREGEQMKPNEAFLRVAEAMKAAVTAERNDLDPGDSAGIEAVISRYAPLARRLYDPDENDHARQEQLRADFNQMEASLALGLAMSADDFAVQQLLTRGGITHDEAVQCYRILHRHAQ